jgi:hypothetical protein
MEEQPPITIMLHIISIIHCAYINNDKTARVLALFFNNANNYDNLIIDENNIYDKSVNKNYSIIYKEIPPNNSTILCDISKFSFIKKKLMAEIKTPDTIIRCKIIEKKIRRQLHIELFELFAHEMNIDYVFENLKLFDYW